MTKPAPVYVLGGAQTDFARNWSKEGKHFVAMMREATLAALEATRIEPREVETAHVGNFAAELYAKQGHVGAFFVEIDPSFSNASRRLGKNRRSSRRLERTQPMAGLDLFISSPTRSSALSRPIPASLHTTSKSIVSGVPSRMAASNRRLSIIRNNRGPMIPITRSMAVKINRSVGGFPKSSATNKAMIGNKAMLTILTPIQIGRVR